MSGEENFGSLFDPAILESLDGALQGLSLQMKSTDEDDGGDELYREHSSDDDNFSDDQTTNTNYSDYTDYTDYTYGTDYTEDDPESGEMELFAMMDSLVAELEMEIDNLENGDVISGDMPLVIGDEEVAEEKEEKAVMSPPKPGDQDYVPVSDYTNEEKTPVSDPPDVANDASTSNHEEDRRNLSRAKSLWKILSGLAQPDISDFNADEEETPKDSQKEEQESGYTSPQEEDSEVKAGDSNYQKIKSPSAGDADYTEVSDYTKTDAPTEFIKVTSPKKGDEDYTEVSDYTGTLRAPEYKEVGTSSVGDSDYVEVSDYTKTATAAANAANDSYIPSKEDFQQLVGVLTDYTKRKRQEKRSSRRSSRGYFRYKKEEPEPEASTNEQASKGIEGLDVPDFDDSNANISFDKIEMPKPRDPDYVPISDYSQASELTEGDRKKAGKAIASYTMKKRREYMIRKRQQEKEKLLQERQQKEEDASDVQATLKVPPTTSKKQEGAKTPEKMKTGRKTQTPRGKTPPPRSGRSPPRSGRSGGQRRKKKKRTNKHRKGKPKKLDSSLAQQQQPSEGVGQGTESTSRRAPARVRVRSRQSDEQTRQEVIQALSQTEAWHWIVNHVAGGGLN